MAAYYNEFDEFAAAWLRELIKARLIADGEVDTRSIVDVRADDLRGFTQCHFFAGIGGWSRALRLVGWPDDRAVWTGSCPCQPFSPAGKGDGFADERHLWPAWFWLIAQRRPDCLFGEQVEGTAGRAWLDLVSTDLEGLGYRIGPSNLPAASVGAPHIRQRLFWVADTTSWNAIDGDRRDGAGGVDSAQGDVDRPCGHDAPRCESTDRVADQPGRGFGVDGGAPRRAGHADERQQVERLEHGLVTRLERLGGDGDRSCESRRLTPDAARSITATGATRGAWGDADWLLCTDGKFRPVESGTQSMVDGLPESLGSVCAESIAQIEEEILSAAGSKAKSREALRDLWETLEQEAAGVGPSGGLHMLQSPSFLLSFLCQLAFEGWSFSQGVSRQSEEVAVGGVRGVRMHREAARASYRRGLDEQRTGEHSDLVRVVSSILARHAQAAWSETFDENASASFPLIVGAKNRAGRLRGYGNAIVPQVAATFIEAYCDAKGLN